ncbi:MAG: hypothetical protein S0880_30655 [Actinomycetota bacterium]|nr:hypothetical protein [Actinomycetota bacterium]
MPMTERPAPPILEILGDLRAEVAGSVSLSQVRAVDMMLDLYNVADKPVVRTVIGEHIDRWSARGVITEAELSDGLQSVHDAEVVESSLGALTL